MTRFDPEVKWSSRAHEAIASEILQASGAEIGGILLGRRTADEILVEDFEPVPCSRRLGRYYLLSDEDQQALGESVEWFRALPAEQAANGLEVLGFCRSRARPDSTCNERDKELMQRFFGASGSLFVLAGQGPDGALLPEVFLLDRETLRPRRAAAATRPSDLPVLLPPATRPRLQELAESPDRSWWWVAGLVALTLAGAVLGYRSVGPPPASSAPPVKQQPANVQPQAPAAEVPKPAPAAGNAVSGMEQGIQAAIQRWQDAILSGDPDLIAACYAPRPGVRRAALRSFQQVGKPSILRISDLQITPAGEERGIATFRKHWQTRGPKVFAGEGQEKLAFMLVHDNETALWKIVSEEETKVYWTERPRKHVARR